MNVAISCSAIVLLTRWSIKEPSVYKGTSPLIRLHATQHLAIFHSSQKGSHWSLASFKSFFSLVTLIGYFESWRTVVVVVVWGILANIDFCNENFPWSSLDDMNDVDCKADLGIRAHDLPPLVNYKTHNP